MFIVFMKKKVFILLDLLLMYANVFKFSSFTEHTHKKFNLTMYWVTQKLPQMCTINLHIRIRDLQYIYAVTSGSPSTVITKVFLQAKNHHS